MAPVVVVPKKSGDVRLCIDYCELNKRTVKDACPLPMPDEVQDKLSSLAIFSTLDLRSGYWQMPVSKDNIIKTAFLAWGCFNLNKCHLDLQVSLVPFKE